MTAGLPTVGVVSLSQGTRPEDLAAGLASLAAQTGVDLDVIVVGNGWAPTGLPDGVRGLALETNVGIPAGRNRGAEQVRGEWIFFLDDDASLPSPTFLADAIAIATADPRIGLLQPRVDDPTGLSTPRRWIPRLRKGDPRHSSPVFSVWEGATLLPPRRWIPRLRKGEATDSSYVFSVLEAAVLMPTRVFEDIGGWGDPYFYAHEGIGLAWRVWADGRIAWYEGDLVAHHPVIDPRRHATYFRLNARNRVWLAKRNLPWLLVPFYVGSWTLVQLLRSIRNREGLGAWFGGWVEGWRERPGGRVGIGWATVWRMTIAGRPPII